MACFELLASRLLIGTMDHVQVFLFALTKDMGTCKGEAMDDTDGRDFGIGPNELLKYWVGYANLLVSWLRNTNWRTTVSLD